MKKAFYDDIPAIQADVTQILKNISSMRKLVNRSKYCIEWRLFQIKNIFQT